MQQISNNLIFCSAKTQYDNLGDLIINKTLIEQLRNYGNVIVNEQGIPDSFLQELSLKEEERASTYKQRFRLLVLLLSLKSLLVPNQNVYYVMQPGHVYGSSIKFSVLQMFEILYMSILRLLGVRVYRFGVSLGPFSPISVFLERSLSHLISFYSVRETISKDYAKKIGIQKVQSFPDLAWLMNDNADYDPLLLDLDEGYVVFSFRSSTLGSGNTEEYAKKLYAVLDEIVHLVYHKWSKKLVISYQVQGDYNFCREIRNRYSSSYEIVFVEERIRTQTMKCLYSRASIVFSNRLHVLLIAMFYNSLGVAIIDMQKHNKITGILSDAGLLDLIVDTADFIPAKLDALSEMVCSPEPMKQRIVLRFKDYQVVGRSVLSRIMTVG